MSARARGAAGPVAGDRRPGAGAAGRDPPAAGGAAAGRAAARRGRAVPCRCGAGRGAPDRADRPPARAGGREQPVGGRRPRQTSRRQRGARPAAGIALPPAVANRPAPAGATASHPGRRDCEQPGRRNREQPGWRNRERARSAQPRTPRSLRGALRRRRPSRRRQLRRCRPRSAPARRCRWRSSTAIGRGVCCCRAASSGCASRPASICRSAPGWRSRCRRACRRCRAPGRNAADPVQRLIAALLQRTSAGGETDATGALRPPAADHALAARLLRWIQTLAPAPSAAAGERAGAPEPAPDGRCEPRPSSSRARPASRSGTAGACW